MTKPVDFDAWYDENLTPASATRPFRIAGRLWQIPIDCPAAALLRMDTMRRRLAELDAMDDPNANLPPDVAAAIQADIEAAQPAQMLRAMIGDQLVDDWITAGITERRLAVVASALYNHYSGEQSLDDLTGEPDAEGKAPATPPATESPTTTGTSSDGSSSTGTPSKPTGTPPTTSPSKTP